MTEALPMASNGTARMIAERAIIEIVNVLPYRTSCHLKWSGVEVHRYRLKPRLGCREFSVPHITVLLNHENRPVPTEVAADGVILRSHISDNTVSIIPPGVKIRSAGTSSGGELTVIFLDPLVMGEIAKKETGFSFPEIAPQFAIADAMTHSIATILDAQLAEKHPCSPTCAELLAKALAAHIFATYAKPSFDGPGEMRPNRMQLRRSIEFIHVHLDQKLTLEDIAAVACMSKFHYAKSFRAVMGIAPHQYLVRLRIEKARRLLLMEEAMSLQDIAQKVGFTDTAHFAQQFSRVVGISPSRYRNSPS
jgi:AraC family transcriptional regulator